VIKAIPTVYNGVQFRSRLEAKWAVLFDLLSWKWEYEPIDLNGYIPDFLVTPTAHNRPTLFEVKPVSGPACAVLNCKCGGDDAESKSFMDAAIRSVQASGWTGHAVVAGATILRAGQKRVPRLVTPIEAVPGSGDWFDTGSVVSQCRKCSAYLLETDIAGWASEHCDEETSAIDPTAIWRQASNPVQWKSPGRRKKTGKRRRQPPRFAQHEPVFEATPIKPRPEISIMAVLVDFPDLIWLQEADGLSECLEEPRIQAMWSALRCGQPAKDLAQMLLDPIDAADVLGHAYLNASSPADEFVTLIDEIKGRHRRRQPVPSADVAAFFRNFDYEGGE
jgi:hypothetical protein